MCLLGHKIKGEKMTEEEKMILRALGEGFTYKEIAKKFAIPQYKARKDIIKKLSARNLPHAVYIAMRDGITQY